MKIVQSGRERMHGADAKYYYQRIQRIDPVWD